MSAAGSAHPSAPRPQREEEGNKKKSVMLQRRSDRPYSRAAVVVVLRVRDEDAPGRAGEEHEPDVDAGPLGLLRQQPEVHVLQRFLFPVEVRVRHHPRLERVCVCSVVVVGGGCRKRRVAW